MKRYLLDFAPWEDVHQTNLHRHLMNVPFVGAIDMFCYAKCFFFCFLDAKKNFDEN